MKVITVDLQNKNELNDRMSNTNKELKKEVYTLKDTNKNYTNYLFLGDSITDYYDLDKYYEGYKVVNSGISGDQTSDILDDLQKRAYVYPERLYTRMQTLCKRRGEGHIFRKRNLPYSRHRNF